MRHMYDRTRNSCTALCESAQPASPGPSAKLVSTSYRTVYKAVEKTHKNIKSSMWQMRVRSRFEFCLRDAWRDGGWPDAARRTSGRSRFSLHARRFTPRSVSPSDARAARVLRQRLGTSVSARSPTPRILNLWSVHTLHSRPSHPLAADRLEGPRLRSHIGHSSRMDIAAMIAALRELRRRSSCTPL